MSQIQEWYYKGRATESFGAKVNSPLPTIIAILATFAIITLGGASFILRDYIYDIVYNPQVNVYANYSEAGYYLNIPYKYDFKPENYIDENNTLKYKEFMDPNNTDYTYTIEGKVNTSVIGDYNLTYSSTNKMSSRKINLLVHVKDLNAPVIKLDATLNEGGEYDPIVLVRGVHNEGSSLGTLDFNANKYMLEVTDDFDEEKDIKLENTGKDIDLEDGTGTKTFEVIYTAVDKAGNSSVTILPIIVMDRYDAIAEAQKERIAEMERELNILVGNWKKQEDAPIEEVIPEMSAKEFTWSINNDPSDFVKSAMNNVTYYGEVSLYPVSGAFITEPVTEPGTYHVVWCTTDGQTCTQTIIVTDDPADDSVEITDSVETSNESGKAIVTIILPDPAEGVTMTMSTEEDENTIYIYKCPRCDFTSKDSDEAIKHVNSHQK